MDNLKQTKTKGIKKISKVLDSIKTLNKYKFEKIDTGSVLPMRKEKLYIHKCEWYEIEEVKNQINRDPLVLSWVEHKYDNLGKEYILYSPHNQLLQVYPKLKLAKDLVLYALDNNIDFSKDSLESNIHYKRESYIEKNAKKTAEKFNEVKKETHNIRKTWETGWAWNMSKALVNKVNNAHSKLVDSASNSL